MIPKTPLPYNGNFSSPEDYVNSLLQFVSTSDIFQIMCGGVHILDFFTTDRGLFHASLPEEWHEFLLSWDIMTILDLFLKHDLDDLKHFKDGPSPPASLIEYIRSVRNSSLRRDFTPVKQKLPILPRSVAVGMKPKKIHEVTNFADYVDRLSGDITESGGEEISHFVDFGSGQNYLGRALASEPYNRRVIAVEGRENNVTAARGLDVLSGLAVKEKVMRNKKLWNKIVEVRKEKDAEGTDPAALADAIQQVAGTVAFDFRPVNELNPAYNAVEDGKGQVQYISGRLDSGDLSDVIAEIEEEKVADSEKQQQKKLMAISIHSCGNLSHFGIRSLVMNPDIRAIAIVGCCYNLMTEKLGPPTYNHAYLRPSLQAVNGRVVRESAKFDPQGFPMSNRLSTHHGEGIRLNITARAMACQAPENWTRSESEGFFTRHFFRAVLQKIFLDRGVVSRIWHNTEKHGSTNPEDRPTGPFDMSTNPVIIGGLRKSCYTSLRAYVRGAVEKLTSSTVYNQYAEAMQEKMGGITDEEIDAYEAEYLPRRKEVCVMWSLMAFSAVVVESLIVTDRWLYLKEQEDLVEDAWVETVFDFKQSPRNLVVVGVKKNGA